MNMEDVKKELASIQELKQIVQRSLIDAPEGVLRCQFVREKYPQYYHVCKKDKEKYPQGRYIRKKEQELAKKLAQKNYDERVLEMLISKEKALNYCVLHYGEETLKI